MECMAVMPALQELNQQMFVQSQIGVLCNVREDHLDEMGPTLDDVARSLSRAMPVGGVCVTAGRERRMLLEQEASRRDSKLVAVEPHSVTDAEMRGFGYITFKENVAIALAVAAELGVCRTDALRGMYAAPPDPGALTVTSYDVGGAMVSLANIFAANDPRSTVMNFRHLLARGGLQRPCLTVINCRPDRIKRNAQMGAIVDELATDVLFLIGHPTKSARAGIPHGWRGKIVDLGGAQRDPAEIWHAIAAHAPRGGTVTAVGNIHGQGEHLLDYIDAHATPWRNAPWTPR